MSFYPLMKRANIEPTRYKADTAEIQTIPIGTALAVITSVFTFINTHPPTTPCQTSATTRLLMLPLYNQIALNTPMAPTTPILISRSDELLPSLYAAPSNADTI